MTSASLQILKSESLSSVVRDEIVRFIMEGRFSPGSKLREEELAGLLGVSRGPVREAFRSLEEAGLVDVSKNRGVFVREIKLDEARELYAVRSGLDELIGRLLAPRITDAQLHELRSLVVNMQSSFESQNTREYFPRDMSFHDRIAEMVGNAKLLEIYRRLVNEMHLVRLQSIQRGGGIMVSFHEHTMIVDALQSRIPETAALMMRRHVERAFDRVAPLLTTDANPPL